MSAILGGLAHKRFATTQTLCGLRNGFISLLGSAVNCAIHERLEIRRYVSMTLKLEGIFRDSRITYTLFFASLLLLTRFALAADVSGKWNGTLEFKGENGQAQTVPAHAELTQQNNVVVGKVWKEDGQRFEIEQGRVTGNEVSFSFRAPEGEEEEVLVHSVKLSSVSSTQMRGTLEFDAGGQKFAGRLTFTRE
jgi:hypothetical protein